jgi:hypothetical protein
MIDFGHQHPGLCIAVIGILLMLNGWLDNTTGLKLLAYLSWFVGGILVLIALSCCIAGYMLFLGILRWPLAVVAFVAGGYAVWHLRPANRNSH